MDRLGTVVGVTLGLAFWSALASADDEAQRITSTSSQSAVVHLDGASSLRLEHDTGMVVEVGRFLARPAIVYQTVCRAPCDQSVAAGDYRVVGPGLRPTPRFTILGPQGVEIEPRMGHTVFAAVGLGAAIAGGVSLSDGSLFLGLGQAGLGNSAHGFVTAGAILIPIGAVLLAAGIPLILGSASSVKMRDDGRGHGAAIQLRPYGFAF